MVGEIQGPAMFRRLCFVFALSAFPDEPMCPLLSCHEYVHVPLASLLMYRYAQILSSMESWLTALNPILF